MAFIVVVVTIVSRCRRPSSSVPHALDAPMLRWAGLTTGGVINAIMDLPDPRPTAAVCLLSPVWWAWRWCMLQPPSILLSLPLAAVGPPRPLAPHQRRHPPVPPANGCRPKYSRTPTHPPLKIFGGGRVEEEGGEGRWGGQVGRAGGEGRWGGGGVLEGWGELQLQLHGAEARLHPPTLCNRGVGGNRGARCCSRKKSGEREPQRLFLPLTGDQQQQKCSGGSIRREGAYVHVPALTGCEV